MKKITITIIVLSLFVSLNSCKEKEKEVLEEVEVENTGENNHNDHSSDTHNHPVEIIVSMGSKSGSNVTGSIILTQGDHKVTMEASLAGLTPGEHAIHIHQNGDCSSEDGKSAGGHWNPTADDHGKWGHDMHHMGDIGNLVTNKNGDTSLTFTTDKWCIGCHDEKRNIIGKSFIVHASADDFKSQPSGAAGARVACGVIK